MPMHVKAAYKAPNRQDQKRGSYNIVIVKILKTQNNENVKSCKREGQVTDKKMSIRITADYLIDTFKDRRAWKDAFQVLKYQNCQPKILYPAKNLL